jgi:hypothetical protein
MTRSRLVVMLVRLWPVCTDSVIAVRTAERCGLRRRNVVIGTRFLSCRPCATTAGSPPSVSTSNQSWAMRLILRLSKKPGAARVPILDTGGRSEFATLTREPPPMTLRCLIFLRSNAEHGPRSLCQPGLPFSLNSASAEAADPGGAGWRTGPDATAAAAAEQLGVAAITFTAARWAGVGKPTGYLAGPALVLVKTNQSHPMPVG